MSTLVLHLVIIVNIYFLALTLYNIRYLNLHSFRTMLRREAPLEPKVSVILPVRNEEAHLAACLDSLLDQSYSNYEIVVVDDNSEDATPAILASYAAHNARMRTLRGRPLEPGWNGKSFACSQAIAAAEGDYLLFTDADTVHDADSISWAVRSIRDHDADFVSAYVRQQLGSLGELLIVPVMYIMTALLIPLGLIPRRNSTMLSFAIGQLIICRAEALRTIDGYERFKGSVVEDLSMAREMKRAGFTTLFLDAKVHVSCRMYDSFLTAFRGIGKSLFGAINSSLILLVVLTCIIFAAIEYPFYRALTGVLAGEPLLSPLTLPVGLFALTWLAKMHNRRISILAVALYPVTFLCLILLALYSAAATGFGAGLEWKGRYVVADLKSEGTAGRPLQIVDFRPLYRLIADIVFLITLGVVFLFAKVVLGLEIAGRENLEGARGRGLFLISNHVLYLDSSLVACAIFPLRTFFSALEETFSMPVVGGYIRLLGAFPLPRENTMRRIAEPIRRMLAMRRSVHFFPEGELVRRSTELREFKAGVFLLAVEHDAVVVPVTFVLHRRPLLSNVFPGAFRVRVVIQEPLDSRYYLARAGRRSQAIREMTEEAHLRMERLIRAELSERVRTG
jgi:chlorobactene glucosyltransferase